MTQQDWETLLEKNPKDIELWKGYAIWLQDEQDDIIQAKAIEEILEKKKYPTWCDGHLSWEWYRYDDVVPSTEAFILQKKQFDLLENYKFRIMRCKGYDTESEAILELVKAISYAKYN